MAAQLIADTTGDKATTLALGAGGGLELFPVLQQL